MNIPECIAAKLGIPLSKVLNYIEKDVDICEPRSKLDLQTLRRILEISQTRYGWISDGTPNKSDFMDDWICFGRQAMDMSRAEGEIVNTFLLCPQDETILNLAIRKLKLIYIMRQSADNLLTAQER